MNAYKELMELFAKICVGLDFPAELSKNDRRLIHEAGDVLKRRNGRFTIYFERVAASDYLMGRKPGKAFRASFWWLMKEETILSVMDGRYDDYKPTTTEGRKPSFDVGLYDEMARQYIPTYPV